MAQVTRAAWASAKNTKLADNSSGDISETDIREVTQDLADSVLWHDEGGDPAIADITDWPAGVTATEVGYLDGVTSAIQTQIAAKADAATLAETVRDTIGAALVAGTNITITPNDGADTITIAASGSGSGDMAAATYDPQGIAADAFVRANHTGPESIETANAPAASWPNSASTLAVYNDSADLDVLFANASATAAHRTIINLARSRGANVASPAAVSDNDYVGSIQARAHGTGLTSVIGARIDARVDGTPGASTVPMELLFLTGESLGTLTERLRIGPTGPITFNNAYTWPTTIGTSGQVPTVPASGTALTWTTPSGSGNVSKVGTPVANRMAYWTGDGTLGHEAGFEYDATTDTLAVTALTVNGGAVTAAADPSADSVFLYDHGGTAEGEWGGLGSSLQISGSVLNLTEAARTKEIAVSVFDTDDSVAIGDGLQMIPIPSSLNGMNIVSVRAFVYTQGVTGSTDVQVRRRRAGANVDVLSTKVTVGAEYHAADGVINTSNDDLATGDVLLIDVDAVHTTPPLGLSVAIRCRLP